MIPTRLVIVRLNGQDGDPIPGADVIAQLQGISVYEGYVLPEVTEVRTDEQGRAVMELWPNELGQVASYYKFTIRNNQNGKSYKFFAMVPNYDVYLDQLVRIDPQGDLTLPVGGPPLPGAPGRAATIQVGTVQTGEANESVTITNSGTTTDAVFNFRIPRGPQGVPGINGTGTMVVGSVATLPAGSQATVVNVGTLDRAVLNFGIPQGEQGPPGVTDGSTGTNIVGVPAGGTVGQVLTKNGNSDYAVVWSSLPTNTGGGSATPVEKYFGKYAWETGGGTNPVPTASPLDATTRNEFTTAVNNAATGAKRTAGSNAVIGAFGATQTLVITRDSTPIITAEYEGALVLFDNGVDIGVQRSVTKTVSDIVAASITTGTWQCVMSGADPQRKVTLSVGPVGSGKQLTLTADTAPGQGFNPTFTLVVPRSVDGLA